MEQEVSVKDRILSAALSLFADRGYDSVGVQEIVTVCGITKPTLYYYFGSKIGLLEAVIDGFGEKMIRALEHAAEYNHDLVRHLTDLLNAQIEFASGNPEFFRLHNALSFAAAGSDAFRVHTGFQKRISDCFYGLFIKSSQEFGNMRGRELLFSRNFYAVTVSAALSVLNGEIPHDSDTVYRIVHSFIYGIAN